MASRLLIGGGQSGWFEISAIDTRARKFVDRLLAFTRRTVSNPKRSAGVVGGLIVVALLGTILFLPKLDYLPDGNQNNIVGMIFVPSGYNLNTTGEVLLGGENKLSTFWKNTDPGASGCDPQIDHFFYTSFSDFGHTSGSAVKPNCVRELIPVMQRSLVGAPGVSAFFSQASIFGQFNISGDADMEDLLAVAARANSLMTAALPRSEGHQVRAVPGLQLGAPELRVTADNVALADMGLTARELAVSLDAFNDGLRVAEITVGGERLDLSLKGEDTQAQTTQGLENLQIVTASGTIVPLRSLASIDMVAGPTEIRHLERDRTLTLEIRPSADLPLEEALDRIQTEVVEIIRAEGLPPGVRITITGTADVLSKTWEAMTLDLLIAIVIVYLIMAVLFENFFYPLVILVSVPLAALGGVAGLAFLNVFTYQALDMLTLLGFIILVGIVVNNAILLVHQSLRNVRIELMSIEDGIVAATESRIRPIFMSTLTSIVGMLPLTLFPGAGSELDRGLGSVVVGGLTLSALLTLVAVPPMMALGMRLFEKTRSSERHSVGAPAE